MPRKSAMSKSSVASDPAEAIAPAPGPADVAARAYFLFLERGGTHGHDWDDWLQAERDLLRPAAPGVTTVAKPARRVRRTLAHDV